MKPQHHTYYMVSIDDVVKAVEDEKNVKLILSEMNVLKDLSKALNDLQDNVIGLFRHTRSKEYEMVVKNENGWLKTITIGKLGGLHENHIGADQGKIVMFDDGQNLTQMKNNPYRLQEIIDLVTKP